MKLTTKGRYAVTAMLDLAVQQSAGSVCLSDISNRQEISLSYLEQLFSRLRKNGLVESTRGPGGGYSLVKCADEVSIASIIAAVDEDVDITRCSGSKNCQKDSRCLTHDLWSDLSNKIKNYLDDISLGDLIKKQSVKAIAARQETVILQRRGESLTLIK